MTSNMVFQMSKLPQTEWDAYIAWLEDFEYAKLELPKPDAVLYFDMPIADSQTLMSKRYAGDENKKDIHEKNISFLQECRETGLYAAEKRNWKVISCKQGEEIRSIEDIHAEVVRLLHAFF